MLLHIISLFALNFILTGCLHISINVSMSDIFPSKLSVEWTQYSVAKKKSYKSKDII